MWQTTSSKTVWITNFLSSIRLKYGFSLVSKFNQVIETACGHLVGNRACRAESTKNIRGISYLSISIPSFWKVQYEMKAVRCCSYLHLSILYKILTLISLEHKVKKGTKSIVHVSNSGRSVACGNYYKTGKQRQWKPQKPSLRLYYASVSIRYALVFGKFHFLINKRQFLIVSYVKKWWKRF